MSEAVFKPGDIVVTQKEWRSPPVYSQPSETSKLLDLLEQKSLYFVAAVIPIDLDLVRIAPEGTRWLLLLGRGWALSTWFEPAELHRARPTKKPKPRSN